MQYLVKGSHKYNKIREKILVMIQQKIQFH